MISLSEPQKEAIEKIENHRKFMTEILHIPAEHQWFNQAALKRVTFHTLQALKNKGFLEEKYESGHGEYYRWIKDVE